MTRSSAKQIYLESNAAKVRAELDKLKELFSRYTSRYIFEQPDPTPEFILVRPAPTPEFITIDFVITPEGAVIPEGAITPSILDGSTSEGSDLEG